MLRRSKTNQPIQSKGQGDLRTTKNASKIIQMSSLLASLDRPRPFGAGVWVAGIGRHCSLLIEKDLTLLGWDGGLLLGKGCLDGFGLLLLLH